MIKSYRRRGAATIVAAVALMSSATAPVANALEPRSPAPAHRPAGTSNALDRALDAVHAAGMPGVMASTGNGEWTWNRASGVADLRSGRRMRPDYPHRVASVTKTFTATAALQLAAKGKIDLDAPVGRYLPTVVPGDRGRRITVRMLLNHTSGIAEYGYLAVPPGPDEDEVRRARLEALRFSRLQPEDSARIGLAKPPTSRPGERQEYSDTNYILIGMIIKTVTGQDAERYIAEHVIRPAGLRHTFFLGDRAHIPRAHAKAYTGSDAQHITGEYSVFRMRWDSTAGGLLSTPSDLAIFFRALLSGRLLPPSLLAEMKEIVPLSFEPPPGMTMRGYGLGLIKNEIPGCGRFWGHNGAFAGTHTDVLVSDDGRRHFTYVLTLSGYHQVDSNGNEVPTPISRSMKNLQDQAVRQALCPPR
ncbi:serine hydrolase domain-containing protein [Actinomadura sp. 9N407]|uniref:serine hydrolase domain-containing protein n=1 Tax=Actinomadura sp. 9N407 TaxID=3375154 RepID=UPI00379A37F9